MEYFKFFKNELILSNSKDGYRITEDAIWLSSVLPLDCKEYLDVGCATGVISFILALKNKKSNITAIDIQPSLIDIAKELKVLNKIENIDFKCVDVFKMTNAKRYDCVFSNPPFFDELKTDKTENVQRQKAHFQKDFKLFLNCLLDLTSEMGILCFLGHQTTREIICSVLKGQYNVTELEIKSSERKNAKRFIYIVDKSKDVEFITKVIKAFNSEIRKSIIFDYNVLKY